MAASSFVILCMTKAPHCPTALLLRFSKITNTPAGNPPFLILSFELCSGVFNEILLHRLDKKSISFRNTAQTGAVPKLGCQAVNNFTGVAKFCHECTNDLVHRCVTRVKNIERDQIFVHSWLFLPVPRI